MESALLYTLNDYLNNKLFIILYVQMWRVGKFERIYRETRQMSFRRHTNKNNLFHIKYVYKVNENMFFALSGLE